MKKLLFVLFFLVFLFLFFLTPKTYSAACAPGECGSGYVCGGGEMCCTCGALGCGCPSYTCPAGGFVHCPSQDQCCYSTCTSGLCLGEIQLGGTCSYCVGEEEEEESCTTGTWGNDSCGWNNECETDEMRQTKTDNPVNCSPPSERCVVDPSCRPAVCQSSSIDGTVLKDTPPIEITITGNPPESTINYFLLAFYNKDNLFGPNNPKPIWFTASTHYQRICYADGSSPGCSINGDSATFTISYDELNHPDLNWGGSYPINIQVNGYFGLTDGGFSQGDGNCVQSFTVGTPACSVSLVPNPGLVVNGREKVFTAYVDAPGWNIEKVDFSSGNTGVATVDPSFVLTTVPGQTVYQTTATGVSVNSTSIKASAVRKGGELCFDTSLINVTTPEPWWQVDSGNVHADGGDVHSWIPSIADSPFLITGTEGLLSYYGGVIPELDEGRINQVADREWLAQTEYKGRKTKYRYFKRILQDDPLPFEDWDGSQPGEDRVYAAEGDMATLEAFTITNEIIVILVNGDVSIDYDISVAEGGFLAIISSGNITIADYVTKVQGVYIVDGSIRTCESATCGDLSGGGTVADKQLLGEGIFVGWGNEGIDEGIDLRRDFNTTQNNSTPAEKFIYRPDLVRNAYKYLKKPRIGWQEVAP